MIRQWLFNLSILLCAVCPAEAQTRLAGCSFKTYSVTGSFSAYEHALDGELDRQVDFVLTQATGHFGKHWLDKIEDATAADISIEAIANPLGNGQVDEKILAEAEEYLDAPWLKIGFNRQGGCKLRVTYLLNEYQIMLDQLNLHDVDAAAIKTASEPYRLSDYYEWLKRMRNFDQNLSAADRARRMSESRDEWFALYSNFPRDVLYAFHLYPSIAVNTLGLHTGGFMEYFNPESVKVATVEGNNAKRIRLAIFKGNKANYASLLQTLGEHFFNQPKQQISFETIRSIRDVFDERKFKLPGHVFWLFGKRR